MDVDVVIVALKAMRAVAALLSEEERIVIQSATHHLSRLRAVEVKAQGWQEEAKKIHDEPSVGDDRRLLRDYTMRCFILINQIAAGEAVEE